MSRSISLAGYILRRALQAVPVVLAVIVITFLLIHLAPGNPIFFLIGEYAPPPEYVAKVTREYGLDRPVHEQLITYVAKVVQGDLGTSYFFRQPVISIILERVGPTLLLTLTAYTIASVLGVFLGAMAAKRPYSSLDHATTLFSVTGYSLPVFWLGQLLLVSLALGLGLFPAQGMTSLRDPRIGLDLVVDVLHHLALPALALATVQLALVARLTRANTLEALQEDYVVTARAKGVDEDRVLFKHALRNSILPVVTVIGLNFGYAISGTILVETVFSWPGLGRLLFDSVLSRDYPVITGLFIFITVTVVIANLLTDILYAYLDPRIRYG